MDFPINRATESYKQVAEVAEKIYATIKSYITVNRETTKIAVQHSVSDESDQLHKLKELFDDKIITEEEFDAKKKQLLGI